MRKDWDDWPSCPECGKRRQAVCPLCQSAGDKFPLGYYVEEEPARGFDGKAPQPPQHKIWLMCEECSEAFRPNFYAKCEACSHDFGGGAAAGDLEREEELSQLSSVGLGVMMLVAAALLYWFVLI